MISHGIAAASPVHERPPLRRLHGWEGHLKRWINRAQNERWHPGTWDCCMSWCDAVLAMTGVDCGARVRGKYTTMEGAAACVIRLHYEAGIRSFEAAVAAEMTHHGLVECFVNMARRGDVVAFDQPGGVGITWGIVDLTGIRFVAAGKQGLLWGPVAKCRRAWMMG